eukprot:5598942-Pyramimonas_sp.AAC.1
MHPRQLTSSPAQQLNSSVPPCITFASLPPKRSAAAFKSELAPPKRQISPSKHSLHSRDYGVDVDRPTRSVFLAINNDKHVLQELIERLYLPMSRKSAH